LAEIVMPQLGETVTEGTITKWLVKAGDQVSIDQPLFEVSTDKVDSEVPSTASGVVSEILVEEGMTVDVGTAVLRLGEPESAPTVSAPEPEPAPTVSAPEPEPAPPVSAPAPQPMQEAVREESDATPAAPAADRSGASDFVLSPVVRRIIDQNGLDPAQIRGTGVGGRITRSDVLAVLDQQAAQDRARTSTPSQPAPERPRGAVPSQQTPTPQSTEIAERPDGYLTTIEANVGERDIVVPFSNIRRRTAQHMLESKAISAHTLMSIEVDFERVERVRRLRGQIFKEEEGFSLTYLPFVSRATIEAVRSYPNVNATVSGDSLIVHRDVHLSIAVDLNLEGLIAPVIHGADSLRFRGLARAIHDLATRARSKRLGADDISGGTFTITNPGPFGTFMTGAIINQPQVAILATDGVVRKPVVVTDDEGAESISVHSVGMLTLNFDHRAIDGAYAAAFLAKMKSVVETWSWEQEF